MPPRPVLQSRLPHAPWMHAASRRLPGVQPLDPADWLVADDAYAGQMALRARLIAERRDAVHALRPGALAAARELLETALAAAMGLAGFAVGPDRVRRPDGAAIVIDRDAPLITLGHLFQEDFCLMQKHGDQHVLTGAILCFPASWRLDEKISRPLDVIHGPVAQYDADIARRVQRLFDAIRPETPLWRANALLYDDPALFQPRGTGDRHRATGGAAPYLRSERQCLLRLPGTGAVVFSIHTYVVARASLSAAQAAALRAHPIADDSDG